MSAGVKTPNGIAKAERRRFADLALRFRGNPEYCVATIDYGTTHCSVNYILYPGDDSKQTKTILVRLDESKGEVNRVPNCILFNEFGKKIAFGYPAREKFAHGISDVQREKYFYFEHVKKTFQRKVSRLKLRLPMRENTTKKKCRNQSVNVQSYLGYLAGSHAPC